jgi:deoxyribodipyrimidine photo-lyase
MPAPTLVWLRNDLRLHDHEALDAALRFGAPVVLVYCVDPRAFANEPSLGLPRAGAFRAQFLLEALADLRASCRAIGGDLVVRVGAPEHEVPALARALGAARLVFQAEVASEERAMEREVCDGVGPLGVRCTAVPGHTLVHVDDLPFNLSELPPVFTQFRRRVEREVTMRTPLAAPMSLPVVPCDPGAIPTLEQLGLTAPPDDPRTRFRFVGGESAGRARVQAWIWERDRLRTYKSTRNGLLDPDDASRFSAWLALGCVSARHVHAEVRRYEAARVRNDDTEWLVVELLWRDYFRFVAATVGNRLFASGGLQALPFPWRRLSDRGVRADFDRWANGTTGYPLVDAAMRELSATGFMSNRARQNAASFLARVLGIDWRVGAAWFESWLVDYDVGSNWGNWAYVSGVGNDARGFRFFNVHKQATDYDPQATFIRHWIPELAELSPEDAHRPERIARTIGYAEPMVAMHEAARVQETSYRRAIAAADRRDQGASKRGETPRFANRKA